MDSRMMKLGGQKSTFKADIQFGRNVICGPPAIDHELHPQMGCLCYYCKKHWTKTGGPPCFKLPRAISIAKDVVLIDGKLYFLRPKTSSSGRPKSNPSTPHAGTRSGLTVQ